ncbi:hypothetical protein ACYZT9_16040 [Pseudomonas sp. ZT5P21]
MSFLLKTLQFDDAVTLLADRGHDGVRRFDVAEPPFILGNILFLKALFIKEPTCVENPGPVLITPRD